MELLGDHVRVAAILDPGVSRQILVGVAEIDQTHLVEFVQGSGDRCDVGLDAPVGVREPTAGRALAGVALDLQSVEQRGAPDAEPPGGVEPGQLGRNGISAQGERVIATRGDLGDLRRALRNHGDGILHRPEPPGDDGAIRLQGHAVGVPGRDLDHSAGGRGGDIDLASGVMPPGHDRAVQLQGEIVIPPGGDGGDAAQGRGGDGSLRGCVVAPSHHSAVALEGEAVILSGRDGNHGHAGQAGGCRIFSEVIFTPAPDRAIGQQGQTVAGACGHLDRREDVRRSRRLTVSIVAPGKHPAITLAHEVVRASCRDVGDPGQRGLGAADTPPPFDHLTIVEQGDAVGIPGGHGRHIGKNRGAGLSITVVTPCHHGIERRGDDTGEPDLRTAAGIGKGHRPARGTCGVGGEIEIVAVKLDRPQGRGRQIRPRSQAERSRRGAARGECDGAGEIG